LIKQGLINIIKNAIECMADGGELQIKTLLEPLQSYTPQHHRHWIEGLVSQAYGQIALQTPLQTAQKRVANEKRSYLQKQIKSSEIVVSEVGAFLGFGRGKIKVKIKGKIVLEAPINRINRITRNSRELIVFNEASQTRELRILRVKKLQ
jgi:hypothetical protein